MRNIIVKSWDLVEPTLFNDIDNVGIIMTKRNFLTIKFPELNLMEGSNLDFIGLVAGRKYIASFEPEYNELQVYNGTITLKEINNENGLY